MASLTKTADNVRRYVVIFLLFVAVVMGFDVVRRFFSSALNPFNPIGSYYLAADALLGSVPKPSIPSLTIASDSAPTFVTEGAFSGMPDTALVYKLGEQRVTFDTVDEAVATAGALGFTGEYTESQDSQLMTWNNSAKTRSLEFHKLTKQWRMRTQYFFDPAALQPKQLTSDPNFYATKVNGILSQLRFSAESLRDGQKVATLSKLGTDGLFTKPLNAGSADYVVIDAYRKLRAAIVKPQSQWTEAQRQVENPPKDSDGVVYTQDPRRGSLRMVVSNDASDLTKDFYSLDYTDFPYTTNFGVYGVVTPTEAWERIRQGQGSLTLLQLQTDDYFSAARPLNVTKFAAEAAATELGYFEPATWDGFVYPIYVFRGRVETKDGQIGRFVFFVDALTR